MKARRSLRIVLVRHHRSIHDCKSDLAKEQRRSVRHHRGTKRQILTQIAQALLRIPSVRRHRSVLDDLKGQHNQERPFRTLPVRHHRS